MTSHRATLFGILLVTSSVPAQAQTVFEPVETLEFDRPESWAMKYFASLAIFTGMGLPEPLGAGGVSLGFEGGIVPELSDAQQTVGFEGTKLEDLNRTRFFGRVRGRIGLGERTSLELGYVPPVTLDGVQPNLLAIGVGHPFALSDSVELGVRGYAQFGRIDGDITCSATEIEGANSFDCEAPSTDELSQRVYGGELTAGYARGALRPYVGVAFNYLDLEFQVDARYQGIVDRTLQLTDGGTVSITGGVAVVASEKLRLTGELFYTPLSVVRPPSTASENDGLFNFRFQVAYRLR